MNMWEEKDTVDAIDSRSDSSSISELPSSLNFFQNPKQGLNCESLL